MGTPSNCSTCHTAPPVRNVFGEAVEEQLLPDAMRPLSPDAFNTALPNVLAALSDVDSDGDGFSNGSEIEEGLPC